ncbi:MAG: CehA/McbA family metallohydrolase [Deltaproteobacteria bacterium]|nr:CehA/McbA family metallohydrolase [Deltaproteobacteria bacterium]
MVLVALAILAACETPPHSRAYVIGSLDDTIGGPHALGRIGDFLLENDQIRLVIADTGVTNEPGKISTYGRANTTFGGTMIDADLRRNGVGQQGNDQLAELLPGFLFTVINPTKVEITARGDDGGPAEVTVSGTGGDLLQMVALLNTGLMFPSTLQFKNVYRLYPGKRYVEIETTMTHTGQGAHPFPYLDPTQLDDLLGRNIPGVENIQLSVPMGQLPLLGGEQDLFAPGVAGFNVKYAIEDSYATAGGFPAFPGLAVDFLASRGEGVSYGLTILDEPSNYVSTYKAGYPGQDLTPYSMLIPFTYAGVAGVFMSKPPAQLTMGQSFSFKSYFVIGKGDVASVADVIYELRQQPTGSFGGRVVDERTGAPVVRANVFIMDAKLLPVNQVETDEGGAFKATLPPGTYSYRVLADDRISSPMQSVTIKAGEQAGTHIAMKSPSTVAVVVVDELGRHAPAKVTLVSTFDTANTGKDPRTFLFSLPFGERRRPTAFDGRNLYIEGAWWTKDGRVEARVRPGTYDVVVSRGPEYEVTTKRIVVSDGQFAAEQLVLKRAYTSDGWVAGDFHLHANPSTDSGVTIEARVISCAAEGLEVAVATDHNFITDYAPAIFASGLDPWLLGIPGMELTTFEMGHFIGYPLKVDPGSTRGGEFTWANQPPQALFDQLRALAVEPKTGIVQIAHPRQQVLGYFAQFFIDAATALPYTPAGILGVFAPYGDEFQPDKMSYDFDAIELVTGRKLEFNHTYRAPNPLPPGPFPNPQPVPGMPVVSPDGRPTYPGTIETWFTMLDRGHRATGIGASDTHDLLGDEPGYARTLVYVGRGKDHPGGFTRDDVLEGVRAHRAITTTAPFIELTIGQGMIGDTIVAQGGVVDVRVRVRAPTWGAVDHLVIYANSVIVADQRIPAGQGTDYETMVRLNLTRDTWIVAEVEGPTNMFPVSTPIELPPLDATVIIKALSAGLDLSSLPITATLKPNQIHTSTPFAITNPIWVDIDGNGWNAPKAALPRVAPPPKPRPDVRDQFESLPELSP